MSVFADSSALVKLYVEETGHEVVRAQPALVASQLARVEVPAALWRKHRLRELDADDAALLVSAFEADYSGADGELPRFAAVTVTAAVVDEAARLAAVHGLRAHDAVQLASAITAAAADPECRTFGAFDVQLRTAAATEGFALLPTG